MGMYPIHSSTTELLNNYQEAKPTNDLKRFAKKYPFDEIQCGQSFFIPLADANIGSLRSILSHKREFKMIIHYSKGWVEIGRVKTE
jgi:hypothetical protein